MCVFPLSVHPPPSRPLTQVPTVGTTLCLPTQRRKCRCGSLLSVRRSPQHSVTKRSFPRYCVIIPSASLAELLLCIYACMYVGHVPCVPHHGSSFILCVSTFFISFLPSLYSIPLLLFPFTAHMSLPFCLTPSSISLHILLFSNPHSPLSLIHLTSSLPSSLILFPHFLSPSLTLLPPFLQSGFHHKDAPDGNVSKGKKMTKDEQKSFDEVHA